MQGHIRKRGRDSWTVVIELPRDVRTEKRRQMWRSVRGTKRDAEELLHQLLARRPAGLDASSGRLTVGDYCERWLLSYAENAVAPKTYRRYQELIRLHITPVIGAVVLSKLVALQVQEAYAAMLKKGLSPRTVVQAHRVLHEALRYAVDWQLIPNNPADGAKPPRFQRFQVPALEPKQVRRVVAVADETRYGPLVYLAVSTGLRLGEILGLRWQDTDLDSGRLQVRQTCQWLARQGYVFRQPKSPRSVRSVALSRQTVERLREQRRLQVEERLAAGPAYQDRDLVFANRVGGPTEPWNLRKAWNRIRGKAEIDGMRFHDLRHAHASMLLLRGTHPKIVSERLGHASVAITLDTYSHVTPNLQAQAARDFEEALANG